MIDYCRESRMDDSPPEATLSPDQARVFGELVIEHQSRVRNYIRSLGVASNSIDDIAQEAFVVAYNRFATYESGTSFPAWVNTIARNLIWNDRRKTARRFKLLNETVSEELLEEDPSLSLAEREDSDLRREALRSCMERLQPEHRNMLNIRYEQDMEPTQAAETLGLKPGTLRTTLMRIRQALRDCITKALGGLAES